MNLKELIMELRRYYKDAEKVERIIINCSLTAATATAAGSAIPMLAPAALIISCAGAVWTMYISICRELGISFGKDALKALASAAVTNIAVNLGGTILLDIMLSVVPGFGIATGALLVFGVTYLSGVMFLNLLLKMLGRCGSIDRLGTDLNMSQAKKDLQMGKSILRTIFSQSVKDYVKGLFI